MRLLVSSVLGGMFEYASRGRRASLSEEEPSFAFHKASAG